MSRGLSISSPTYLPFFLRWRTHSVSRYSICPLMERKSSSAHDAISSNNFADILRGTCFFSAKTSPALDFLVTGKCQNLMLANEPYNYLQ